MNKMPLRSSGSYGAAADVSQAGGSYHDGSQWVITFERGPLVDGDKRQAVQDLRLHLAHMSTLNPSIKGHPRDRADEDRLLDHYLQWPGIGMPGGGLMLPMDAAALTRDCWVSRTCCAGLWSRPAAIR